MVTPHFPAVYSNASGSYRWADPTRQWLAAAHHSPFLGLTPSSIPLWASASVLSAKIMGAVGDVGFCFCVVGILTLPTTLHFEVQENSFGHDVDAPMSRSFESHRQIREAYIASSKSFSYLLELLIVLRNGIMLGNHVGTVHQFNRRRPFEPFKVGLAC